MTRRLIAAFTVALLGGLTLHALARGADPTPTIRLPLISNSQTKEILISALFYDGFVSGEADEAFQIFNPNDFSVALEGWQASSGSRIATFPAGPALAPQGSLWCAREAVAFQKSFGALPGCEYGADTDPGTPNLKGSVLQFANTGGRLVLSRPGGEVSDVLFYEEGDEAAGGWRGPSVAPYTPTTAFHQEGQILYRKLDELTGLPVPDTDSVADWAQDPGDILEGRRVRYPGWQLDRFFLPASGDEEANLQVFVVPDHAFDALAAHLRSARSSICLAGYTFENAPLGDILAEQARQGVAVTMLLEGAPPGGVTVQQRWIVGRIAEAGGRVFYMRANDSADIHDRYLYGHAKLWLLDDHLALVGTENPSPDSFPNDDKSDGTLGRRGVYLATDAPLVVARVQEVMTADLDAAHRDIWPYDAADPKLGAAPADFSPILVSGGDRYAVRFPEPLSVRGRFHFELCQAPEHSLRTRDCFLGLVGRAGADDLLLIEQLDEPAFWGPSTSNVEADPNPRLQAYIDAARRGARVRLLLDAFFDDLASSRSNLRTAEYLTAIARTEGLDLEVRRANPTGLGLHNKMALAQIGGQGWVMAGSLNGGEVSAKLNREISLVVSSSEAFSYLAEVFWHDWNAAIPGSTS